MTNRTDVERAAAVAAPVLLAIACFFVLRPFALALIWAAILAFATWPIYVWVERLCRGSRSWASLVMCALVLVVLIGPFVIIGVSLADDAKKLFLTVKAAVESGLPNLPDWLAGVPWVGEKIQGIWSRIQQDPHGVLTGVREWASVHRDWFFGGGLAVMNGLILCGLTVFMLYFFYCDGREIASWAREILRHLMGDRADSILETVARTVRGVLYGMLGTALAQAALAWIGFLVAGVPLSILWGFLTFFLSLVPAGPPFIWVPACIWLFSKGSTVAAVLLALWGTFAISGVDNIVKPYLISRGAQMPFVLVLIGVAGGVLAFGAIGLFAGPVVLAVAYGLLSYTVAPPGQVDASPLSK